MERIQKHHMNIYSIDYQIKLNYIHLVVYAMPLCLLSLSTNLEIMALNVEEHPFTFNSPETASHPGHYIYLKSNVCLQNKSNEQEHWYELMTPVSDT